MNQISNKTGDSLETKKVELSKSDNFTSFEYISAITHELKTPLNAIIGFSDMLQEELANVVNNNISVLDVKALLDYVKEINNTAQEMNELVHDLLDAKSINSGNFSVDLTKEIDVIDIVKRALRLNHDYALLRHVNFKMVLDETIPTIKLDSKRMKQILTNLISNAVKYSPPNSEVKILIKNIAGFLEIKICDQGFGMTLNQVKTAFEKYGTIENPNSGKVDSFGFGLPIVKQLVELQNGIIEVESELNKGTIITLKFPY